MFWRSLVRFLRAVKGRIVAHSVNTAPSVDDSGLEEPLLNDNGENSASFVVENNYLSPLVKNILVIIGTSAIFYVSNEAYWKISTIFLSTPKPNGRGLTAAQIGYVYASTALSSVLVQVLLFTTVEAKYGFTACYRASLLVIGLALLVTPFVGWTESYTALVVELVLVQTVEGAAFLMGMTTDLLLVLPLIPCLIEDTKLFSFQ
jgi:hypothetical protein